MNVNLENEKKIITDNIVFIRKRYLLSFDDYGTAIMLYLSFYNDKNSSGDSYINIKFYALKKGSPIFEKLTVPNIMIVMNQIMDIFDKDYNMIEKVYSIKFKKVKFKYNNIRMKVLYERLMNNYVKRNNRNITPIISNNEFNIIVND